MNTRAQLKSTNDWPEVDNFRGIDTSKLTWNFSITPATDHDSISNSVDVNTESKISNTSTFRKISNGSSVTSNDDADHISGFLSSPISPDTLQSLMDLREDTPKKEPKSVTIKEELSLNDIPRNNHSPLKLDDSLYDFDMEVGQHLGLDSPQTQNTGSGYSTNAESKNDFHFRDYESETSVEGPWNIADLQEMIESPINPIGKVIQFYFCCNIFINIS